MSTHISTKERLLLIIDDIEIIAKYEWKNLFCLFFMYK